MSDVCVQGTFLPKICAIALDFSSVSPGSAQVYMYREEWDRCEEIFEALLEENADDTHILNNLGRLPSMRELQWAR